MREAAGSAAALAESFMAFLSETLGTIG